MPILPVKYIFNYFLNECSGLVEIKAGPIFAGKLKLVKSLTIAVWQHEIGETFDVSVIFAKCGTSILQVEL